MPAAMRSGRALLAGDTTAIREPGATAPGLSTSANQNLALGDKDGRPREDHLLPSTLPLHQLGSSWRAYRQRRTSPATGDGRGGGSAGSCPGGCRRSHAALKDTNLDLVRAQQVHKLHVGLLRKLLMEA